MDGKFCSRSEAGSAVPKPDKTDGAATATGGGEKAIPAVSTSSLPDNWQELNSGQKIAVIAEKWRIGKGECLSFKFPEIGDVTAGRAEIKHMVCKKGSPEVDALLMDVPKLRESVKNAKIVKVDSTKPHIDDFRWGQFTATVFNKPVEFSAALSHNKVTNEWKMHHIEKGTRN